MTEHHSDMESLVRDAAPSRFAEGFVGRVASRIHESREVLLSIALERQFRRVVPIAAAASLMLAAYNWWGGGDSGSSPLDAALNLPRVSLSSAYSTSTLIDGTNIPLGTP